MIEDMTVRGLAAATRRNHIRAAAGIAPDPRRTRKVNIVAPRRCHDSHFLEVATVDFETFPE